MSDKCTEEIKTKVPDDLALRWRARARRAGCSPSELLRDLICITEHGMTFGELETKYRRDALGFQAPDKGIARAYE
ncbi:MAG: hypothetical protein K9K35_11695 [Rhodoferax sp.]|jgi:hypothetical protein|nr:hypothetical protein [Rhodoferax sp.]